MEDELTIGLICPACFDKYILYLAKLQLKMKTQNKLSIYLMLFFYLSFISSYHFSQIQTHASVPLKGQRSQLFLLWYFWSNNFYNPKIPS